MCNGLQPDLQKDGIATIVKINDKHFTCECGSNFFFPIGQTEHGHNRFECISCQTEYCDGN